MVKKIKRPGCKICLGIQAGECFFCRYVNKARKDMSEDERRKFDTLVSNVNYLKETKAKLVKFKMKTTGDPSTDALIKELLGDWIK